MLRSLDRLILILTSRCNLNCTYCFQNRKTSRTMSRRELFPALDLARTSPVADFTVLFYGGEPLIEFPLLRQAVEYLEQGRALTKRYTYVLVTNGLLMDSPTVEFLSEHNFETMISFDGVRASQDLRGKDTFDVLDRLLERLRRDHSEFFQNRFSVNITLSPASIPFLADSVKYFLEKDVRDLGINPILNPSSEWNPSIAEQLDQQFAVLFKACLTHAEKTGVQPLSIFRGVRSSRTTQIGMKPLCGAASARTPAVDVDGRLYGCALFARSYQAHTSPLLDSDQSGAFEIGRISDPDMEKKLSQYRSRLARNPLLHEKRLKASSFGRCSDCPFLGRCFVCPVSIALIPGNADPHRIPDFLCDFNRISLKYQERMEQHPVGTSQLLRGDCPDDPIRRIEAKFYGPG